MQVAFENVQLEVKETKDHKQWYMTVEEVAQGYDISPITIRRHLGEHPDELREGVERDVQNMNTLGGNQKITIIYREGVIKLGFFIRSKRAAAFRQWATNLIVEHMDNTGLGMQEMFKRLDKIDREQTDIKDICRGLRDEVDELRAIVGMIMSDDEEKTIRDLVKKVKFEKKVDGRAIVGHVRKTLNVGTIYDGKTYRAVINTLRNMLGEGLTVVKKELPAPTPTP